MHCSYFSRPAIFTYNTVVECCLHITKNIEVDVRDICSNTFPFKTAKMFFWKSSACGKNFGGKSFTFTHDLVLKYFVFKYFLVLLVLILPNFTSNLFQSKSKKNLHFTKRHGRNILLWKYDITLSTEYLKTLRDSTSSSSRFSCDELDQNIISLCNMGISPAT